MAGLMVPSRRTLLKGLGATAGFGVAAPALVRAATGPTWSANPFSLGVAAGAPDIIGFSVWTRLAPSPEQPNGGMSGPSQFVTCEVASDENMRHIVKRGTAYAEARFGYSAHYDFVGLQPGRPYWYRFTSGNAESAIGRAMTLPLPGKTQALKFAYFSCSNYEYGYFSAYRHAAEENPDFGVFLGDYIYEYADPNPKRVIRPHSGGKECETLDEYRARYTQYRLDPNLQFLHASMPTLVTWDDHEVQNDYADKWGENFQDPQAFLQRPAAAYQAFYEFMPLRSVYSQPHGPAMRVYDGYDFGDLLRINLIDGRQYRSREACYRRPDKGGGHLETPQSCPQLMNPERSMLGEAQEKWLLGRFGSSHARWNVIANDVLMARLRQ